MKTIIELAREAEFNLDGMANMLYTVRGNHAQLERFATLVEAAHTAELMEGVEMPEPALPKGIGVSASFHIDYFTANQLRETVAAAVLREREECAKVCEDRLGGAVQSNEWWGGFKSAMKQCASAIRNRSNS